MTPATTSAAGGHNPKGQHKHVTSTCKGQRGGRARVGTDRTRADTRSNEDKRGGAGTLPHPTGPTGPPPERRYARNAGFLGGHFGFLSVLRSQDASQSSFLLPAGPLSSLSRGPTTIPFDHLGESEEPCGGTASGTCSMNWKSDTKTKQNVCVNCVGVKMCVSECVCVCVCVCVR